MIVTRKTQQTAPAGIVRGQKGTMNEKDRIEEYRTKIASGELKPAEAQRELAGWLGCTPTAAANKLSGKNARRGTRRF